MKEKLLISACLLGHNVKYNGLNNKITEIDLLKKYFDFIIICPEVDGGLPIPRNPSERLKDKVISAKGKDVTKEFLIGKTKALELVKKYHIKYALLKEKSPSCGKQTYDGTFTHSLIERSGITAEALINQNIKVYSELEIEELIKNFRS